MKPQLSAVTAELPDPPYHRTTRAKGIKFEVDTERLYQSKTWIIAPPELRPWLLMLWVESWRSIPVGTFDDDDEMIAARIGMPLPMFSMYRQTMLRGWSRHSDGRLYHDTITEKVLELVQWRDAERTRKEDYRNRKKAEREAAEHRNKELESMSRGTPCPSASATTPSPSPSPSPSPEEKIYIGGNFVAPIEKVPAKKPAKRFIPPTVAEVAAYCAERGNQVDPAKFVDHYEAGGWMRGKTKLKDWKAAVRTWEKNHEAHHNNNPRPESAHDRRKRINQEIRDRAMSHFSDVG